MKKVVLCKRRSDLSREAYSAHWRDSHGPLLESIPSYRDYTDGYAQNHYLSAGPVGGDLPFDGISDIRQKDASGAKSFSHTLEYRTHVVPDEAAFIDRDRTLVFAGDEHQVKLGSARTKLVVLWHRNRDSSRAEALANWRNEFVGRFFASESFEIALRGYVQTEVREGSFMSLSGCPIPVQHRYDGMDELWFDSRKAAADAFASLGDEAMESFADNETIVSFYANEIRFF
ncbi:EthD domain-containing protein [Paracoccus sp. MKU1]|uniref:EthD domain-containing protein n=1 Tax=Paracoccus sp. MKU1 TaxID=1745182 RepID=UPI0007194103|nr:EthD domain-containing protein [Paracoccus sp. MKU1]KRW97038.1 hypothetical protein AQY21_05860 [Paracoccus sp. MKU1]